MSGGWSAEDIPDQSGRVAVVTGANSGLGLVCARELARGGAEVILACRDVGKGERAAAEIRARGIAGARLEVEELDLAALSSVRAFAGRVRDRHPRVDLLINNAGVMAPPRGVTEDGFESQLGTNHLGHFALTGLLLDALLAAPAPRVVTVSSGAHRLGRIDFEDLMGERRYQAWRAYGQSKLANLMFCFELARRAAEAQTNLLSVAAHPGYAATNLQFAGPAGVLERAVMALSNRVVAQSAEMGALPSLYAAVSAEVGNGTFVGPDGFMESQGHPRVVSAAGRAYDESTWRRLWELSEELTGVRYAFAAGSPVTS